MKMTEWDMIVNEQKEFINQEKAMYVLEDPFVSHLYDQEAFENTTEKLRKKV